MLSHYWWPGNIRELENLIERVVATAEGEWITDDDLPFEFHVAELDHQKTDGSLLDRALSTFERNFIIRALERSGWNVTQTARYLDVPLSTLKFKMDRLEIREIARGSRGSGRVRSVGDRGPEPSRRQKSKGRCLLTSARSTCRGRTMIRCYLRGRTASLSCLTMRALTTVLAGILMGSPVAGLRPMRALRFCTTSFTIPGSTNSPERFSSFSHNVRELVEEFACLRSLHLEPFGEVRKQLRFAHPAGFSHRGPPGLCRARVVETSVESSCARGPVAHGKC